MMLRRALPFRCSIFRRQNLPPSSPSFQLQQQPRRSATSNSRRRRIRPVDEELQSQISEFDQKLARPRSLAEIIEASTLPRHEINAFLQEEFSIRCAQRICMFQERIGYHRLRRVPELSHAYNLHLDGFEQMQRHCSRATTTTTAAAAEGGDSSSDSDSSDDDEDNDDFTPIVRSIVENGRNMVPLLCKGMSNLVELEQEEGSQITESFVNQFLDEILLNRIGSNVLMSQYLSLGGDRNVGGGIVDPRCNVTAICGTVARQVRELCHQETGYKPTIRIESHSNIQNEDPHQKLTASFPFIPGILTYILQELMKNSAVATAARFQNEQQQSSICSKTGGSSSGHHNNAISVVICADERRVMIHIGDKGGGIPFDVGQHIWSYLYTTKQEEQKHQDKGGSSSIISQSGTRTASNLGGFGVGLPLSRLYATYLGGSVKLVSLPGYGTHAYVYLPRLPQHLVEVVPDSSSSNRNGKGGLYWGHTSKGEFIL